MSTRPVLVVTGPTASGKSSLALELARRLDGEIISADSVQVYRGADVGSAKPSPDELASVPHHLISILSPDEPFDAARFAMLARAAVDDISARGKQVVIAGGTGLYLRALLGGLAPTPEISEEARGRLGEIESACSPEMSARERAGRLHDALSELDPYTAAELDPADSARVRRALLVTLSSGLSLRQLQELPHGETLPGGAVIYCLLPERSALYARIEGRVRDMLEAGLEEETRSLLDRFPERPRLFDAIGYRHMLCYLDGEWSYPTLVEELMKDTRRFAKRQYTWWRHQPGRLGWLIKPGPVPDPAMTRLSDVICGHWREKIQQPGAVRPGEVLFFPLEDVSF